MPPPLQAKVPRKIAILGFRATGKTTLATHFVEGQFVERYDPTIENTFQKTIPFRRVRFLTEIVDSAGIDEHSRLSRSASLGVHGYLLVYSVTSRQSFEKMQAIDDLVVECHGGSPSVARVLVATMIDNSHERQVAFEEGQAVADARGIPFIETTAKGNVNVSEAFLTLLREIERENGVFESDEYGGSFIDDPIDINPFTQCWLPSNLGGCLPPQQPSQTQTQTQSHHHNPLHASASLRGGEERSHRCCFPRPSLPLPPPSHTSPTRPPAIDTRTPDQSVGEGEGAVGGLTTHGGGANDGDSSGPAQEAGADLDSRLRSDESKTRNEAAGGTTMEPRGGCSVS